jgi:hypothetical protein
MVRNRKFCESGDYGASRSARFLQRETKFPFGQKQFPQGEKQFPQREFRFPNRETNPSADCCFRKSSDSRGHFNDLLIARMSAPLFILKAVNDAAFGKKDER